MTNSEWIALTGIAAGLFVSIIGSTWYLSNNINRIDQRLIHVEENLKKLIDIVAQMRIEMNLMQGDIRELHVKVDILWKEHQSK